MNKNQHIYKCTKNDGKDLNLLRDSASLNFTYQSDDSLIINHNPLNDSSATILLSTSQKTILIYIIILQLILIIYYDFFNIIIQFFHLIALLKYGVIALKSTNRI